MLENINENKLLFLDIETVGAYKDSFELREQNSVFVDTTLKIQKKIVIFFIRSIRRYYLNLVKLYVLVLVL